MSDQLFRPTEAAVQKLQTVRVDGREASACAIRIRAVEAGTEFRYEFSFVELDSKSDSDSDTVMKHEGLTFYIDENSGPRLQGATLDYIDSMSASGFKFDNPNQTKLASNPLAARVQHVLDERINPGVAQHGGAVTLEDIEGSRVFIRFGGGCQGCGQADATLSDGIMVALKEAIPEITEVLDATDHAAGTNPYA